MDYYIILKKAPYLRALYLSPEAMDGHDYQEWFFGESRRFRFVKVVTEANLTHWLKRDFCVATYRVYNPDFPSMFEDHLHLCPACGNWFAHVPGAYWPGDRDECILAEELQCEDCTPPPLPEEETS